MAYMALAMSSVPPSWPSWSVLPCATCVIAMHPRPFCETYAPYIADPKGLKSNLLLFKKYVVFFCIFFCWGDVLRWRVCWEIYLSKTWYRFLELDFSIWYISQFVHWSFSWITIWFFDDIVLMLFQFRHLKKMAVERKLDFTNIFGQSNICGITL